MKLKLPKDKCNPRSFQPTLLSRIYPQRESLKSRLITAKSTSSKFLNIYLGKTNLGTKPVPTSGIPWRKYHFKSGSTPAKWKSIMAFAWWSSQTSMVTTNISDKSTRTINTTASVDIVWFLVKSMRANFTTDNHTDSADSLTTTTTILASGTWAES